MKTKPKFGAKYRCTNCNYKWTDYFGPYGIATRTKEGFCPMCKSPYAVCLNIEEVVGGKKK